jgi:MoxR-like ATPase
MAVDELQTLALIRARDQARALLTTLGDAMVEIDRPARLALCCLLAEGHLLIEDVPGVGKTTLARIMARAIGGHDARIQCTADLTAAKVIGELKEHQGTALREPEFERGPIFANAVVFDELNRATPQLQSALLEAMEEKIVTVGKGRYPLPRPFFVVATMNPHDNEGTYELPHPQRDRFAMRTDLGYASEAGEVALLDRFAAFDVTADIDPIVAPGDIVKLQRAVSLIEAPLQVREYLVRLLRATRDHDQVLVGASPRAILSMFRCCQAMALVDNCTTVRAAHVRDLFVPCISHRLRFRPGADEAAVVQEVLEWVSAPAEPERGERMADAGPVLGGGQFDLRELDAFRQSA